MSQPMSAHEGRRADRPHREAWLFIAAGVLFLPMT
jgi:hypothetical protein